MHTALYTITMHTAIPSMLGLAASSTLGALSDALTVLAVIVAWLFIGSAIAWTIGNASDLGETSEK
jgi:hypothetical protein